MLPIVCVRVRVHTCVRACVRVCIHDTKTLSGQSDMNYIPTSWNPWLCVRLAIIPYLSTQVWVQYTCTQTLSALRTGYRQLRGLSPPADTFLSLERNLDPSQASWPYIPIVLYYMPYLVLPVNRTVCPLTANTEPNHILGLFMPIFTPVHGPSVVVWEINTTVPSPSLALRWLSAGRTSSWSK